MDMARLFGAGALALLLAGCAAGPGGSIYIPAATPPDYDRNSRRAPEPATPVPSPTQEPTEPATAQPQPESEPSPSPSYQDQGEALSGAAASLVRKADSLLAQGNVPAAIGQLERAQRIAPRSAEVYFKLAEAYVAAGNLSAAEQFTLKGLSLAGSNDAMQRAGWLLLADIRRARGNVAGADQAESRAAAR
ncbi:MAG: tetratricopeptide repeat protein [Marinobacter sp.]|uniref:tetratricopeptide repeat protein n=1 Tax=Marinobacter sp. TaxID=50741 RepID=UPI00299E9830|nr:tetratricopeptide repeat protein [Marinobacter sp.]MDX1757616.1 tetratricopeptide repeat protein [Marinobacter sp.]